VDLRCKVYIFQIHRLLAGTVVAAAVLAITRRYSNQLGQIRCYREQWDYSYMCYCILVKWRFPDPCRRFPQGSKELKLMYIACIGTPSSDLIDPFASPTQ
jgi:hypothetical protein